MPSNKNFQKRVTILDRCFSNPNGRFTLKTLGEILSAELEKSISRRSIQDDIKYIRNTIEENWSDSVDFAENSVFEKGVFTGENNKEKVFRYAKREFALGNQLLNSSDQEQLEETLALLSRYRNREDFQWLDELFPRIENSFSLVHEDYDGLISYQSNRDYTGQSWVGVLYNQLLKKNVILVEYKSFNQEESQVRKIHPFHIKQFNDRWFLFGYQESEKYTGLTSLALDRILDIEETNEKIIKDSTSWGDYFDEMIGVSRKVDEKPVNVLLRFSKGRINYVLTKPLHGSQRMVNDDLEGRTIKIQVIPNRELIQRIMSFGADVEVLEPSRLREEVKKQVSHLNQIYG